MDILDGDTMHLRWQTRPPHPFTLVTPEGGEKVYQVYVNELCIFTPQAIKSLARGYVINFLERWTVTEFKIILRKLKRRKNESA